MLVVKGFLIIFFITLILDDVFGQVLEEFDKIDPVCLGCICDAASNCDRTLGCSNGGCGLFRIHNPYWIDGGRSVIDGDDPDNEDAWMRCTVDSVCAAKTVVNYINRYRKDCNGDGKIDCVDYALIHKLGGVGCDQRLESSVYEQTLKKCLIS